MSDSASEAAPPSRPAARPLLLARVPDGGTRDPARVLDRFLAWAADAGFLLYTAQEEALLELAAGRHVILATPTGSGKSLVALALHFKALCEGTRSFYTAPTKALVNEKFFALCEDFGAANVGMLTGDAAINREAPIICCTAEVLSNMALRAGDNLEAPYVVMDEFHYYGDRERGMAWQVPLLALPRSVFLLMSATLGDTRAIERALRQRTGRAVACVRSNERPVPLEYEYRETPLHETVETLVAEDKAPIYVVSFTQRECGEHAQALTSAKLVSRADRLRLAEALEGERFDSPYGKDLRRFLRHGIGVHHAGLLPRYRRLIERLAQRGLLRIVCGTDTLGVGVNVPIRTVLFTRLYKFDGEKTAILTVRDFQQIAGRAGRKGFDEKGWVVAQAPAHVIENRRRAQGDSGRRRPAKPAPSRGFVPWNRDTFERLASRAPEPLAQRFALDHGVVLNLLERESESAPPGTGYRALAELIDRAHVKPAARSRLRREAATLFRTLRRAELVRVAREPGSASPRLRLRETLQRDFSLHHSLSLWLVEEAARLDRTAPSYALDVLSRVEAILENPNPILAAQARRAREVRLAELKAAGVPYEDRIRELDDVTYPKPDAEAIYASFNRFAAEHPWVRAENIRPKSVAREMIESFADFSDLVRRYGIARSEGSLLRYLDQVFTALARTVPASARTEELEDLLAFLRVLVARVDASLLEEWERLREPAAASPKVRAAPGRPAVDPPVVQAQLRAELHRLVDALARGDYAEAASWLRPDPEDPWDAARLEEALAPLRAEFGTLVSGPEARRARNTTVRRTHPGRLWVSQLLLAPEGSTGWCLEGEVSLDPELPPDEPLLRLRRIGL